MQNNDLVKVQFPEYQHFRENLIAWAASFSSAICLEDALSKKLLVGVGVRKSYRSLAKLPRGKWLFGQIAYDYKNKIEDLVSEHPETISFPSVFFFEPQYVLSFDTAHFAVLSGEKTATEFWEEINSFCGKSAHCEENCTISPRLARKEYLQKVEKIQQHIRRGDIYEINFCQEFFGEKCNVNPLRVYNELTALSPMPFAAFFKWNEKYALCSSPERYVQKNGEKLISQPIKGTARRGKTPAEDQEIIHELRTNMKECAENVMAVDVVRNDFSRLAQRGSVAVDELCGVYTFQQLHQMISTVSAKLRATATFEDIIRATFPMASMTGAPKLRAMQLAEQYETSKRGLYSGTIGYLSPDGDFDFNVVIRTILYGADSKKLSFTVGGAITAEANAEKEYEECLLKAEAMIKILGE